MKQSFVLNSRLAKAGHFHDHKGLLYRQLQHSSGHRSKEEPNVALRTFRKIVVWAQLSD